MPELRSSFAWASVGGTDVVVGRGSAIRRVVAFVILSALIPVAHPVAADDDNQAHEILIVPFLGEHFSLVEAFLQTSPEGRHFNNPDLTAKSFFAGFADVDGDEIKDLLVLVDHDTTCDGDLCDLFVFSPVVKDRSMDAPCDWSLVEKTRTTFTTSLYERFITSAEQSVTMTNIPWPFWGCRFNGAEWTEYFRWEYDTYIVPFDTVLSDIRVGTYDVNGDGRDEVFIYIISLPICDSFACRGAILEVEPPEDGEPPAWRKIGELSFLDPILDADGEEEAYLMPGSSLHVINETVDGYVSLCSSKMLLRWNGEAYDHQVYYKREDLLTEARALGCPQ